MESLSSRVVETREGFDSLGAAWNDLLSVSGSDHPFLTFECLRSCWNSCFGGIDPFVLVIESRRGIVGLIPLAVQRTKVARIVRFLGGDTVDCQDMILHPEARGEAFDLALRTLDRIGHRWDGIDFRKLREDSPNRPYFDRYARSDERAVFKAHDVSPYLKVTGSWEEYVGRIQKKLRKDTDRQRRRLEQLGELRIGRVETPDEIVSVLEWYHRQKSKRAYRDTIARGSFGDTAGRSFLLDFAQRALRKGWLALDTLQLGGVDQPLAISISLTHRDRFFYWLPSINGEYLAYSPGRILLVTLLERAFRESMVEFDFLNGGEFYKYQWLGEDRGIWRLTRYSGGMRGFVRRGWVESLRPCLRRSEFLTRAVRYIRKMMETGIHD